MGIYSNGAIYGLKIYLRNDTEDDDGVNVLFEIQLDSILSDELKKQAKICYLGLSDLDKSTAKFEIYTECTSTYNLSIFRMWMPITSDLFIRHFDIYTITTSL
jgi:hypothetical protein